MQQESAYGSPVDRKQELLESAELFKIENLLWGTEKIAKTYGYIGFVPGDGLYIKLVCVEKNPLRIIKRSGSSLQGQRYGGLFFNLKEMIRQQMIFILTSK